MAAGLATTSPVASADGQLDPSFGLDGRTSIAFDQPGSNRADWGCAAVRQSGGRIVVGGLVSTVDGPRLGFTRLLSNGDPDVSFGSDGKVVLSVVPDALDLCPNLAVQADGKILATGTYLAGALTVHSYVVRLTADGALDPSFGTGGMAIVPSLLPIYTQSNDTHPALLVQSDAKILLASAIPTGDSSNTSDAVVYRLTASGAIDTPFGDGFGGIVFDMAPDGPGVEADAATAMVDLRGLPVVVGTGEYNAPDTDVAVARLTSSLIFANGFDDGSLCPYLKEVPMADSGRRHLVPRVQAVFVTFLWATSWVLIKVGLKDIPAVSFAGLRYALAFLLLASVLLASPTRRAELRKLGTHDWLHLSLLGVVFYALTQGAQFVALASLPAVTLSLILSFSPAVVALLGATLLGEPLTHRQWVGTGLFMIGATIYFLPLKLSLQGMGLAVAVVGLLANSGASLLGRAVNRRGDLGPLLVTVVSMGVGSLLLLVVGFISEGVPQLGLAAWGIVLWLAVVNTALAFTIWNHTLRTLTAIESTLINNTMLIQIAILAWIFLGEPITPREGVGLIVAVLGVVVVQLAGARSHDRPSTMAVKSMTHSDEDPE